MENEMTVLYSLVGGKVTPYEFNKNLKIILVGVPGAFTPTCTDQHLPGFVENLDELKEGGIDKVIFFAANDPSVMDAWNKLYGHEDIDVLSDHKGEFSKSIGEGVDFGPAYDWRTKRCAYLVENGEIGKKFADPFIQGILEEL
jgi:peroxiredoxin|tara:strand:- start:1789 stop:2217 length:429 start_codon:yes stop_codon:yes gene_type:complete